MTACNVAAATSFYVALLYGEVMICVFCVIMMNTVKLMKNELA